MFAHTLESLMYIMKGWRKREKNLFVKEVVEQPKNNNKETTEYKYKHKMHLP